MTTHPAPIAVFAYKRKEHLQRTVEALRLCRLAGESDVYFFLDGAKNEADRKQVEEVRAYVRSLPERNWFASLSIREAERNQGLSASIIGGVSEIIRRYGRIIVVEDDIVVQKEFLLFLNGALDYYEKQPIWSVSSYTPPIPCLAGQEQELYLSYRGHCWGWASWKDRWETVDWQVKDYADFRFDRKARKAFNQGGNDLSRMLDAYMAGAIDSWAVRWNYAQHLQKKMSVTPGISLSANIGLDGSGENCGTKAQAGAGETEGDTARMVRTWHDAIRDEKFFSEYRTYYDKMYPLHVRLGKQIKSLRRRLEWKRSNQ